MKLQILSIRKIPVQRAMVAIDILGIVCAKLHTEMEKWRNDSSIIPKKLVNEIYSNEEKESPSFLIIFTTLFFVSPQKRIIFEQTLIQPTKERMIGVFAKRCVFLLDCSFHPLNL